MDKIIIDFGSRSIKIYHATQNQKISLIDTINWQPLERLNESSNTHTDLQPVLEQLSTILKNKSEKKYGIGTAFARRNPSLAQLIAEFCKTHNTTYETISQQKEANLITTAFSDQIKNTDIFNSGGGSIQISRPDQSTILLDFGISDLNKEFSLNKDPNNRRISECIKWVSSQLPPSCNTFVYSGGEFTYLKTLGVPIDATGRCLSSDFRKLSKHLARLSPQKLDALSPFGTGWMSGALASNCIVLSAISVANVKYFYASDLNVAHGLIKQFAEQLNDNIDIRR